LTRVVDIVAEIELLPAEASGKTRGYRSGVRPNHFFADNKFSIIGVVTFGGPEVLELGMKCNARVRFLWPEDLHAPKMGERWRIQEGSHLVGRGRVVAMLSDTSK